MFMFQYHCINQNMGNLSSKSRDEEEHHDGECRGNTFTGTMRQQVDAASKGMDQHEKEIGDGRNYDLRVREVGLGGGVGYK